MTIIGYLCTNKRKRTDQGPLISRKKLDFDTKPNFLHLKKEALDGLN